MIKLFVTLILLSYTLYASKILSYNIYDRTERVDVMITFDTPYAGVIKQSINASTISIKLYNASIESAKLKQLSSRFIRSLSITPMSGFTKIVVSVSPGVRLIASKTSDSYGLRLRFTKKVASSKNKQLNKQTDTESLTLPTKKSDDIAQSYYVVIAILIIGILILLFVKKRVTPSEFKKQKKALNKGGSSWLFKETQEESDSNVNIRFQKSIDEKNSVVMLDFSGQSYLVMMGTSNVLLDRFTDNKPESQEDFNTILQSRHKELDNFLNPKTKTKEEIKKPIDAYKERASSSISWDV